MIWFLSTYPTSSPTVLSWPTLALLLLHHAKLSPTSQPLTMFLLLRMLLPQIFLQHPASHQSNLCSSFISSQGLSLNSLSKVTPRYPGFNSILFFFWYLPLLEILFIYLLPASPWEFLLHKAETKDFVSLARGSITTAKNSTQHPVHVAETELSPSALMIAPILVLLPTKLHFLVSLTAHGLHET